jgi:hypothetical protein
LPAKAPTELIEKGLAVDAQASLAQHYGMFKPATHGDVWRADEFVVAQFDDIPIEEKEPTWSSYGLDSGVLSNRFNLIFWDDLIDRRTNRTAESRADLVAKWDEELENRLEPGGLLAIDRSAVARRRICTRRCVTARWSTTRASRRGGCTTTSCTRRTTSRAASGAQPEGGEAVAGGLSAGPVPVAVGGVPQADDEASHLAGGVPADRRGSDRDVRAPDLDRRRHDRIRAVGTRPGAG